MHTTQCLIFITYTQDYWLTSKWRNIPFDAAFDQIHAYTHACAPCLQLTTYIRAHIRRTYVKNQAEGTVKKRKGGGGEI